MYLSYSFHQLKRISADCNNRNFLKEIWNSNTKDLLISSAAHFTNAEYSLQGYLSNKSAAILGVYTNRISTCYLLLGDLESPLF